MSSPTLQTIQGPILLTPYQSAFEVAAFQTAGSRLHKRLTRGARAGERVADLDKFLVSIGRTPEYVDFSADSSLAKGTSAPHPAMSCTCPSRPVVLTKSLLRGEQHTACTPPYEGGQSLGRARVRRWSRCDCTVVLPIGVRL
jgi:hypothetical protein